MAEVIDLESWDDRDAVFAVVDDLDGSNLPRERQQELGDAVTSLLCQDSDDHWWHDRSPEETVALLEVFAHTKPGVGKESLAKVAFRHLRCCSQCVLAYHTAQVVTCTSQARQKYRMKVSALYVFTAFPATNLGKCSE